MLSHKLNHLLTHSTAHHGWQIINNMSKPPLLITIVFLLLHHAALSRPLITVYKYHTLRLCNHPKPLWVCDGWMHRDPCHHCCIQYMSQPCADLGLLYMWLMLLKPPWITTAAHTFFFFNSESPLEYPLQVMESGSNSKMGQLGCKNPPLRLTQDSSQWVVSWKIDCGAAATFLLIQRPLVWRHRKYRLYGATFNRAL